MIKIIANLLCKAEARKGTRAERERADYIRGLEHGLQAERLAHRWFAENAAVLRVFNVGNRLSYSVTVGRHNLTGDSLPALAEAGRRALTLEIEASFVRALTTEGDA